jgi:phage-related protein
MRIILTVEARDFLHSLPRDAINKITYNMRKVQCCIIDNDIFKKLENSNIWEFRTLHNRNAYRLFAFWDTDEETLIIATHGIKKKTQKTPTEEIAKAERIRKQYFEQKKK